MPRLNHPEYFARRSALRTDWRQGAPVLRRLTAEQQWALHDFYLLSHDLPDAEVLTRRDTAVESQPTLTRSADMAYRSFTTHEARARQQAEPTTTTAQGDGPIAKTSLRRSGRGARPLIAWSDPNRPTDRKLLAEALILNAKNHQARDEARAAEGHPGAPIPAQDPPQREPRT